ncbi:MAG: hypothetical protein ACKV22_41535 [Bryobacteraceae bacterium]
MNRTLNIACLLACGPALLTANNPGPCSAVVFEKRSTAIVVGAVLGGLQDKDVVSFQLSVKRVLKGDVSPGAVLAARWRSWKSTAPRNVVPLPEGVWFLRAGSDGAYDVVPVFQGTIPLGMTYYPTPAAAPSPAYQYTARAPVLDKVALELAWAAEQSDREPMTDFAISRVMRGYDSPAIRAIYQRFAESPKRHLRATGLAGLIRLRDWNALARLANEIKTLGSSFQLAEAVMTVRDPSPEVVRAMARIGLESACNEKEGCGYRESAVLMLADVHTRESLPYLAAMLDDKRQRNRGQAVRGFTLYVGNYPIATPERVASGESIRRQTPSKYETEETRLHSHSGLFKDTQEEARIVAFWKSWWARNQVELTREP